MTTHSSELTPPQETKTNGTDGLWRFIHRWRSKDEKEVIETPEGRLITPQTQELLERIKVKEEKQIAAAQGMLLLHGPTGTGKTMLVESYAETNERNLIRFDCNKNITRENLLVIAEAIKIPNTIIFFDEFNTLPEGIIQDLHSLFSKDRYLTFNGEKIKAAENVFFVGAMNPAKMRNGVAELDIPINDRMSSIHIGYPRIADWDENGEITYIHSDEVLIAKKNFGLFPNYTYQQLQNIWDKEFNNGKKGPKIDSDTRETLHNIKEILLIASELRYRYKHRNNNDQKFSGSRVNHTFSMRDMGMAIQELTFPGHLPKLSNEEKREGMTIPQKVIIDTWIEKIRRENDDLTLSLRKLILTL